MYHKKRLNRQGGIQKFVDKLNIFFMHYHIFMKTLPSSNKSNRFGCSYKSYRHNCNVHIPEVPHRKFSNNDFSFHINKIHEFSSNFVGNAL